MAVDQSFKNMVETLNDLDAGVQSERTKNIPATDTSESKSHIKKLLENFDSVEEADHLQGKDKFRAKRKKRPGGESPHPARGKLVGEDDGAVEGKIMFSTGTHLVDLGKYAKNQGYPDLAEKVQEIQAMMSEITSNSQWLMAPDHKTESVEESPEDLGEYKDVRQAFEDANGRKVVPANKTLWNIAKEEHKEVFESSGKRSGNQFAMKWYQQNGGTWKLK